MYLKIALFTSLKKFILGHCRKTFGGKFALSKRIENLSFQVMEIAIIFFFSKYHSQIYK
jgi:hypothetical protein